MYVDIQIVTVVVLRYQYGPSAATTVWYQNIPRAFPITLPLPIAALPAPAVSPSHSCFSAGTVRCTCHPPVIRYVLQLADVRQ